jgi:hypothetical protein
VKRTYRVFNPEDVGQVQTGSNEPDPVVDITLWRAPNLSALSFGFI